MSPITLLSVLRELSVQVKVFWCSGTTFRTLNTSVRFLKDRSGSNVFDPLVTIGFVDLQPAATEALVPHLPPVLKARFERRPLDQRDSLSLDDALVALELMLRPKPLPMQFVERNKRYEEIVKQQEKQGKRKVGKMIHSSREDAQAIALIYDCLRNKPRIKQLLLNCV